MLLQEISLKKQQIAEKEDQFPITILIIVGIVAATGIGGGLVWLKKHQTKSNIVTVIPQIKQDTPKKDGNTVEPENKEWKGI